MFGDDDLGFWQGIVDVATGRGQLRLVLQPLMAIALGIRFGIGDAKSGAQPFLLRLLLNPGHRMELFKAAIWSVVVPLTIAIVLDGVLQYIALGYVRPLAAVVVGMALIFVPFAISRALANRVYRRSRGRHAPAGA